MKSIAVLVATYEPDVEKLAATLQHLGEQTYSDVSVFLINDGSSALTNSLVENLCCNLRSGYRYPLHYIENSNRLGQSGSYNSVIFQKDFDFDYVTFLDDDRVWGTDDHLEILEKALSENPEFAGAYTSRNLRISIKLNDQKETPFKSAIQPAKKIETDKVWGHSMGGMHSEAFVDTNSKFLRVESLKAVGGWNEFVFRKKDWELDMRLTSTYGSYAYLPLADVTGDYDLIISIDKVHSNLLVRGLIFEMYKNNNLMTGCNWWPVGRSDDEICFINFLIEKYNLSQSLFPEYNDANWVEFAKRIPWIHIENAAAIVNRIPLLRDSGTEWLQKLTEASNSLESAGSCADRF